ncbi:MAG: hypothetical protein JWP32_1543 [Schumannella sp.]|jgi:hypothetical protein|nr:hypothetical protein [Schumannella sp.]
MSLPPAPSGKPKPSVPSWQRIAIWVVVAGVGLYLVISGVVGIIAKGG